MLLVRSLTLTRLARIKEYTNICPSGDGAAWTKEIRFLILALTDRYEKHHDCVRGGRGIVYIYIYMNEVPGRVKRIDCTYTLGDKGIYRRMECSGSGRTWKR